jgi:hypothetical protein
VIPLPYGFYSSKRCPGVLPIRSWEARQKIGEIEELLVADPVEYIPHRCVVAASRIVLVRTQRLHEVVLTLASQPRHLLGTGKIRVMAERWHSAAAGSGSDVGGRVDRERGHCYLFSRSPSEPDVT